MYKFMQWPLDISAFDTGRDCQRAFQNLRIRVVNFFFLIDFTQQLVLCLFGGFCCFCSTFLVYTVPGFDPSLRAVPGIHSFYTA
jgi:hypothetical protein